MPSGSAHSPRPAEGMLWSLSPAVLNDLVKYLLSNVGIFSISFSVSERFWNTELHRNSLSHTSAEKLGYLWHLLKFFILPSFSQAVGVIASFIINTYIVLNFSLTKHLLWSLPLFVLRDHSCFFYWLSQHLRLYWKQKQLHCFSSSLKEKLCILVAAFHLHSKCHSFSTLFLCLWTLFHREIQLTSLYEPLNDVLLITF